MNRPSFPQLVRSSRGLRLAAFTGALAVGTLASGARTPEASVEGVAAMLGDASDGQVVRPADVRWEPSGGALSDLVMGRRVLFLASPRPGDPRDVWRGSIRVTPDGRPLGVAGVCNLTSTPLGDDHALVALGDHAAFATFVYGQEQSVSLLELSGDRLAPAGEGIVERVTRALTNVQETCSADGLGRVEVALDQPAQGVGLSLEARGLAIDLRDPNGSGSAGRRAFLDYDRGELGAGAPGMHAEAVRHLPKRLILWAVDTVRAVSWIGPAPIAWLEEHVFAAKDELRQLAWKAHGADGTETLAEPGAAAPPPPAAVLDASQASEEGHWPPPNVASIWKTVEPGEGIWVAPRAPWMKKLDVPGVDTSGAPPAMLRTFVRPDPDRPYARVVLVAMDMRQLDLDMEAGTEDPKPLTGGHGPGRIPRDPAVYTRVVAAFNGAFKTEHGNYGMMVNKKVLLPPQPSAATVVVLDDKRVGFGTWADTHEVDGIRGIDASRIVSFRQNLDALVDQGEVNPMGRALWGYTLPGQGMQTERSGICVTTSGHVLYAWGDDVSGTALGKAMKSAGCDYAMHLDMNPHHTGFIFASITDLKQKSYKSELLTPLMTVSPERYIEYAPKDFFYALFHDPTPPAVGSSAFRPLDKQPPPAWAPALWAAKVPVDGETVVVTSIEPGRASFRVRAGTKEPDAKTGTAPLSELESDDAHKVMLALGLGRAEAKHPRGLATDGRVAYPVTGAGGEGLAALVARPTGALEIVKGEELGTIAPHTDLAEVPLLVDAGAVTAVARKGGARSARAALGVTPAGRVLVAEVEATSDAALAEALRRAGCARVVALDRGSHSPPFAHRAGTDTPPRARYDDSTLYVLTQPLLPRAFRFEANPAVAEASTKGPRAALR